MVSTLAPSSPPPTTICLAYLHLELSFIVITTGGHVDHAEEAGVTDVEVVVSTEGTPPILE